jgi:hypothetical protein
VFGAIAETVTGAASTGEGESFRLRPRWPSVAQLEYVQKFSTAALLALGLLLLLGHALYNPSGAAAAVANAAKGRLGA